MSNIQESVQEVVADEISLENQRPRRDVKKIIVAVHGIGDQFSFATIQTVAHRFCRLFRRARGPSHWATFTLSASPSMARSYSKARPLARRSAT